MIGDSMAPVFEIREFTVHDGPGNRVTVFLKGCPLRCLWCHNPEGQSPIPELMVKTARCRHCGRCTSDLNSEAFRRWGRDPELCPENLISVCGQEQSAREIVETILPLKELLLMNGGGVTFSGGEPLLWPDFVCEASSLLHSAGLPTAIETSGFAEEDVFCRVIGAMDYVMMDLKLAEPEAHIRYTGQDNALILKNAEWLKLSGKRYVFRTPMIPGITDTEANLAALAAIVKEDPWEKLPYNTLAGAKYPMLGRKYELE